MYLMENSKLISIVSMGLKIMTCLLYCYILVSLYRERYLIRHAHVTIRGQDVTNETKLILISSGYMKLSKGLCFKVGIMNFVITTHIKSHLI